MWIIILLAVFVTLIAACRKPTIYTDEPVYGRYVILNKLTGIYAYGGRMFMTKRGAIRAYRKLGYSFMSLGSMFEVQRIGY
jgi:hypothetical protein